MEHVIFQLRQGEIFAKQSNVLFLLECQQVWPRAIINIYNILVSFAAYKLELWFDNIDCADYSNVLGNIALERLSATIGHWKGKYFAVRIKLSQRFQF